MKTHLKNHKEKHELKNNNEELCCETYINVGFYHKNGHCGLQTIQIAFKVCVFFFLVFKADIS